MLPTSTILNTLRMGLDSLAHEAQQDIAWTRQLRGLGLLADVQAAQQYLDALPQMPRPDWTNAPEWAMWWAMNGNGGRFWFDDKPNYSKSGWWWVNGERAKNDGYMDPPLGIDWRLTLQRRPEVT